MKPANAERLLSLLGASNVKWGNGKLHCSCPLARWTHRKGTDEHPSFCLYQSRHGRLRYNCLSCHEKGPVRRLFWRHLKLSGRWIPEINELVYEFDDELKDAPVKSLEYAPGGPYVGRANIVATNFIPITDELSGATPELLWADMQPSGHVPEQVPPDADKLVRFSREAIPDYVTGRGFAADEYREFDCGYDPVARRWVFPCRTREGILVGYTGRILWDREYCFRCGMSLVNEEKTTPEKKVLRDKCKQCRTSYVKYWHYPGEWKRSILFGAHRFCDGAIVVVEGPTDVLWLHQLGVKCPVAALGSEVHRNQVKLACSMTDKVYVMGDGDKAGIRMNSRFCAFAESLGHYVQSIALPENVDPGNLSADDVHTIVPADLFGR